MDRKNCQSDKLPSEAFEFTRGPASPPISFTRARRWNVPKPKHTFVSVNLPSTLSTLSPAIARKNTDHLHHAFLLKMRSSPAPNYYSSSLPRNSSAGRSFGFFRG
jgi:hypothetical protein